MLRLELFARRSSPRRAERAVAASRRARRAGSFSLPSVALIPAADPGEWALVAAGALLLAGLAAAAVLALRRASALARALAAERAGNRELGVALAAAPGSFWTWTAGGAGGSAGRRGRRLGELFGVAEDRISEFDDLLLLLRAEAAVRLKADVTLLRERGSGFTRRVETADGARILEARGVRVHGAEGEPAGDTVWFRDITEAVVEREGAMEGLERLAAENASLRHVLDGLAVPAWVRGPDLSIVYCNPAYARAVDESSPAAAIAGEHEIASGPTGWGRALAERADATRAPATRSLYVVVGGARRLFEITEFPVGAPPVGADGAAWPVAGFAVDRTDADDARTELARHMAAHAEVLEKLGTGIVIYGPDTRLQFFNAGFARMWGLDPQWLRTLPTHGEVLEELRTRRAMPEESDFLEFKRKRMELYTSLIEPQEELLHLPDERVFRMIINPHPLGGLLLTCEDVTDRMTLERSYNTLIAVRSETLDNLHEGVAVFGSDGRLKLFNPAYARIWKLDPDMLEGEPRIPEVLEAVRNLFVFEGPWESFRERLLEGVADRTARTGRFERADGSILDFAAVPLPDGAMLFSYVDVTDTVAVQRALKERNEALLAADRLKSEFITNVSYELRTPLNTIIGFTEILSNQYFGGLNERQGEYTRGILESSQQLLMLIDDILDLALIEAGRLELELAPVDVRTVLDAVEALAREHARARRLTLKVDCPKEIGAVTGDERRLKQALFNVVSNAVRYTPSGGRITISAKPARDGVTFAVTDTGPGIPDKDHARIFEKFERGHGGDTRGAGVGIGLALVKSFVELHGGTLALDSEVGKGTTVSFTLPARARPAPRRKGRRQPGDQRAVT